MASPLSPTTPNSLNTKSSDSNISTLLKVSLAAKTMSVYNSTNEDEIDWDEGTSSPFVTELIEAQEDANSPIRQRSAHVTNDILLVDDEVLQNTPTVSAIHTPFEIAEDDTRTFHTSKSSAPRSASPAVSPAKTSYTVREDITVTTRFTHDPATSQHSTVEESEVLDSTSMSLNEDGTIDDTCFSTFSEVHNADMTAFARLGQRSPTKQALFDETPRPSSRHTPATSRSRLAQRSSSPTPRNGSADIPQYQDSSDTTNLLLDFTQQFESISLSKQQRSPTRPSTKPQNEPQLLSYLHTQRSPTKSGTHNNFSTPRASGKTILNLLDFELPPAPTPRSVPSITIRELESLKSKYSSEISSLRATLSGREAEVEALKRAITDAERRVGEAVESAREERNKREYVEKEKEEWERRGREFEDVLRKVKEEVMEAEKERNDIMSRIEEAEERAREAESRAADAEARAIEAATKVVSTDAGVAQADDHKGPLFTADQVQKQIDEKVHTLSTELHAIYKKKHVTKVAGLKKGFEAKTREKTAELQALVDQLEREREELQARIDATLSGVLPADLKLATMDADPAQREEDATKIEEQNVLIERQKAELVGRDEELRAAREEFAIMMKDLERERIEKGELVAAVDEMLALQADISTTNATAGNAVEDFKKSIGIGGNRPTGLRGPGFGSSASRIGAPPTGLTRSTSGGKSRMMSNIERMASGRSLE